MAGTDRRSRARKAIRQTAHVRGLPTDLNILSERWNTVAQLGDSDVVARVATLADLAREDPVASFQLEVSACQILSERGAPVQKPIGDVELHDDFAISFWHYIDGEMGEAPRHAMVESLAHVHSMGQDLELDLPWFSIVTHDIPVTIAELRKKSGLSNMQALRLADHFERKLAHVVELDLPGGFVHGDAQRKNAIAVGDKAIWIDFEDCCIGPHAWDLSCLTMNPKYPTEMVLDEYAEASGMGRIPSSIMDSLWALRDLGALTWMLSIQDEREPEFRESAQELLSKVLEASDG